VTNRIALGDQDGQTMSEFSIVLGMITIAIVTTISLLSGVVLALFQDAVDAVSRIV
jgi:Flp pilus assembly pilin Flp